ncbi:MAG: phenylalanine--tRNA ligase subunit alpha, partial [Bacteroidota bacterium]
MEEPAICYLRSMEKILESIELYSKEISAFAASNAEDLEQFRIKFLGVKGIVKSLMGEMQHIPADQKKSFGQTMNGFKQLAEDKYNNQKDKIAAGAEGAAYS